MKMYISNFVVS